MIKVAYGRIPGPLSQRAVCSLSHSGEESFYLICKHNWTFVLSLPLALWCALGRVKPFFWVSIESGSWNQ